MPDFGGKNKSNRCRLPSPPSSSSSSSNDNRSSSNPHSSNYPSSAIDIDIPEIQSLPNGRKPDFGTGSGNSKRSQPQSQPSSPSSRFTKKYDEYSGSTSSLDATDSGSVYAGASFHSAPSAVSLPKPSFMSKK
ncbi:unnamed protein product [Ambrosiozyma monospora]|uniref:Unnamed protein product n=1 Tax=Ambrosiozyma monospora TaxID=43982 RepID=A0A9W6SYY2_AMBMO|nr:unnamed protein product [Ambrosiozyma monospora]